MATVKCAAVTQDTSPVSPAGFAQLLNRWDSVSSDYHQTSSIITNQLDFKQDPPHGPTSAAQKLSALAI